MRTPNLNKKAVFANPHIFMGTLLLIIIFSAYNIVGYYNDKSDYYYDKKQSLNNGLYLIDTIKEKGEFRGVKVVFEPRKNSYCAGYRPDTQTIVLYEEEGKCLDTIRYLFHEYGHYIYRQILSEDEIERYCSIFEKSDYFVTLYAIERGCEEDFAESYSYLMLNENRLDNERKIFFYDMRRKYGFRLI